MFIDNDIKNMKIRVLILSPIDSGNISDKPQPEQVYSVLKENGFAPELLFVDKKHKSLFNLIRHIYYFIKALFLVIPKFDILHIFVPMESKLFLHFIIPFVIGRLFGKKIILSYNSTDCLDAFPLTGRIVHRAVKECDLVTVNSPHVKDEFGEDEKDARLMIPALNSSLLYKKKNKSITPRILVDYAGNRTQNFNCLLKAFNLIKQKYPRTELTIISSENEFKNIYDKLSVQVENGIKIADPLNVENLSKEFCDSDIYLNGSRDEFIPPSMMTAIFSGLPVVTFENKTVTNFLNVKFSDSIFDFHDHISLANKLIDIVESPDLFEKINNRVLNLHDDNDSDNISSQWSQIYRTVVIK